MFVFIQSPTQRSQFSFLYPTYRKERSGQGVGVQLQIVPLALPVEERMFLTGD